MPAPEQEGAALTTLGQALRAAAVRLGHAGIERPRDDARRLAAAVLGLSGAQLLSAPERPLDGDQLARLEQALARRARREPVARILGCREFYGRSFALSPATLEPRPDSETLVTAALQLVDEEGWRGAPIRILDVGTGSGCLLVSLLLALPNASGVGTDISLAALLTARQNAVTLGVGDRCQFIAADALAAVTGSFAMLISNPPYIASADIAALAPEVRCFDPHTALDGGDDGLRIFRRLARDMGRVVRDGWIVLEVGYDQADAVAELLARQQGGRAVTALRRFRDVAGLRRCVAARARIS
jgi:release factor glutamine methyltransferase